MNKLLLIGNIGREPDMQYTPGGKAVTKFSLAVNRVTKSASGEKEKSTDWFNIVAWEKLAETMNQYLHKGDKVYIEGRLTQRKYEDKNGITRYMVEVVASEMEFLTTVQKQETALEDAGDPLGDLEHPF